ncbi:helix-turn-helix domain-containing protein [Sphingomonas sp. M1-B02]|uniref:helix-turn-helix domain-containing protein n=1 Tax=Sphingomonas sp. M1-B02 TaxID=3114300 RepID=UPI00223ECCBD|nr:AraC family transcriptional regulator [Sphingomonas sp. S6-11]UZK64773.1 AraC family transcriptional regulator [Sphingomonas sp. S6-11]
MRSNVNCRARPDSDDPDAPSLPTIELRHATGRLLPHVESYYLFRGDGPEYFGLERVNLGQIRFLIRGEGEMTFPDGHREALKPIMVAGPGSAAASYRIGGCFLCFGVVLRAIGWKALIGIPAHKVTDHIMDGERLFCDQAPQALERMRGMESLDDMIAVIAPLLIMRQEEVNPVPPLHFPFLRAVREWAASEDPTIDALYAAVGAGNGLGERQVQRLCLEYFGGSPTTLKRKFRAIRAAMKLYQGANLSEVLEPFADQSHMINEVRHFTGYTPTSLRGSNDPTLAFTLHNETLHFLPEVLPEPVDLRGKGAHLQSD